MFIAIGLVFILPSLVAKFLVVRNTEYAVTNRRIYSRRGIISRNTTDASLEKLTDVSVKQGVWGRLVGYGSHDGKYGW